MLSHQQGHVFFVLAWIAASIRSIIHIIVINLAVQCVCVCVCSFLYEIFRQFKIGVVAVVVVIIVVY